MKRFDHDEETLQRLGQQSQLLLHELTAISGTLWKEAHCESHAMYGEMVIWILLYHDSDLHRVHEQFCQLAAPRAERIQPSHFDVSYYLYTNAGQAKCLDNLSGNEIFSPEPNRPRRAFDADYDLIFEALDSWR